MEKIELLNINCIQYMQDKEPFADLIVTDPPYKTIGGGCKDGKNSVRPKGILSRNSGNLFKHQKLKISDWMKLLFDVLKDNSHCYIFTNSINIREMMNEADKVGFKLHNVLVWEKNNCTPSQFYMKNCEYVLFLRKGRAKYINNIGGSKTVHKFNNIIGNKSHPCEKPVDLLEMYITNSSNEGDTVFDPFMGTGSCGVACIQQKRNFVGCEIDEEYFKIAQERLNYY